MSVTKAQAERCVTHHGACDCQTYATEQKQNTLKSLLRQALERLRQEEIAEDLQERGRVVLGGGKNDCDES